MARLANSPKEKEALLRSAVAVSPDDWRCWLDLAGYLSGRAIELSVPSDGNDLAQKISKIETLLREAEECFGRALNSPNCPKRVYAARGGLSDSTRSHVLDLLGRHWG